MHRMPALFSGEKSSTATSEGCKGKTRKSQAGGRYGPRRTSTADASSQWFVADRRSLHRTCKTISGRQGASSSLTVHAAKAEASLSQSLVADTRSLHKACEKAGQRCASSSVAAPHAAEGFHTAAVKSTSVSSDQQAVEMSTGKDSSERQSRPETWQPALQVASAIAPSDTRSADSIRQASGLSASPPVLPRQLTKRGYLLASTEPCGRGACKSIYPLTRKNVDKSEASRFVVKFPVEGERELVLKGVNIQERLASSEMGDKYIVPVVEKVMENGEFICHVEPEGTPASQLFHARYLDLKQKLHIFQQMFEAVEVMHAQEVVNLDIKLANIIMKNPIDSLIPRFCDFDVSMTFDDTDQQGIMQISTCESACHEVLQGVPYLPVMVDLWATTLTVWHTMALKLPSLHWLSGMLRSARRDKIRSELIRSFPFLADHTPEGRLFPDGGRMTTYEEILCDRLCKDRDLAIRKKLQLFFWNNLEFPDDTYKLRLPLAERCILREMLSIMFLPSSCSDKFRRMMNLITAASRCALQVSILFKCNEEEILQTIRESGYQPCERVERLTRAIQPMQSMRSRQPHPSSSQAPDGFSEEIPKAEALAHIGEKQNRQVSHFMVRKRSVVQILVASKIASRDDLRDMLIDYLASGGSLESLEEKNDSHLFAWLTRKWQSRCGLPTLSPDSGRHVDSLPPTGRWKSLARYT